jgi:hypothetical protein
MRLTSDLEIPDSKPRATTRSSTFLVETPCTEASITRSMRRRPSRMLGKKLPDRSFGILRSTSTV